MSIIDVDAHFEPGDAWLDDMPELRDRMPSFPYEDRIIAFVCGDLLRDVPRDRWPATADLVPPGIRAIMGKEKVEGFEDAVQHPVADAPGRVRWLDRVGIDVQNVICVEGITWARFLEDRQLARDVIAACNGWLADQLDGYQERLLPVTALDLTDLDWSVAELQRMRERGSRFFLIGSEPVDGLPPMHPRFDRLWSAATDLGMAALLHIGFNPARFDPAWANTAGDMYALRQIATSQAHQSTQVLLNAMVFGGVFERHPNLTVLLAELNIGWLPYTVAHMESRTRPESELFIGKYPFSLAPTEFVRRNVRITPLPHAHQSPLPIMEELPETAVFSSDFPHFEGNPEPTLYYRDHLAGLDQDHRDAFFFGNIADSFRRMQDPLPAG